MKTGQRIQGDLEGDHFTIYVSHEEMIRDEKEPYYTLLQYILSECYLDTNYPPHSSIFKRRAGRRLFVPFLDLQPSFLLRTTSPTINILSYVISSIGSMPLGTRHCLLRLLARDEYEDTYVQTELERAGKRRPSDGSVSRQMFDAPCTQVQRYLLVIAQVQFGPVASQRPESTIQG